MEKLNIYCLKMAIVVAVAGLTSPAFAGEGFRMHSKSPVYQPKRHKGYVFGYGGVDTGSNYRTTGAFDDPHDPHGHAPFNLGGFPIDFDMDNGATAGGGVGVYSQFLGGTRFEIEGSYTSNEVGFLRFAGFELPADFDLDTTSVMFNLLKEVPLAEGVTSYFGGGIGWATTDMDGDIDTIQYNDTDNGFAWQLIAGVDFPITERLAFFTQYRYLVLSDLDFTTNFGDFTFATDDNPASHAVLFGARVSF